ncbi:MAG: DUF4179 domain-containing protein [Anaerolineae bacterium]|nr:DUF4179 domain-containing protein [Anaerolineae bacterium]
MNERHIRQALVDIAEQEIPDTMASLWPAVQEQLQMKKPRRVLRATRLGWVALIVALSLTISAATYAFYQLRQDGDPGLTEIQDKNLVTEIGQSVTLDGVTVTLDWAYADAHRIALAYRLEHAVSAGETAQRNVQPIDEFPLGQLTDDQGVEFPPMFGGGGGSSSPADSEGTMINVLYDANANFDARAVSGTPDSLHLRFELWLGSPEHVPPMPSDPADGSGSGSSAAGGGGGGGGGDEASPAAPVLPPDAIGPFAFEFSVPFIPAVIVESEQTVTAGGVAVTLERAAVAPSLTRVWGCFDLPFDEKSWSPVATLNAGATTVEHQSVTVQPGDAGQSCFELGFLAPYDRQAATWTLLIERFEERRPLDMAALEAALAKYGIEIAVYPEENGRWETTYVPPDVNLQAVLDEVFTSLAIAGPWSFTLEVPGS